ncbi:MAG: metallophosphoesterase [Actinomycetota bacterium]
MSGRRALLASLAALVVVVVANGLPGRAATTDPTAIAPAAALTGSTVAVIGDYGVGTTAEANVATLVAGWNPSAVVTVGDNYYGSSGTGTGKYDLYVGRYYCSFLKGAASGTYCGGGTADVNRFFPATGNHDYTDGPIANYTGYFALPGTELVYSQVVGDVEFFFIDSQACLASSGEMAAEKTWLQNALAASTTAWQVVLFHHPPYSSSSTHGSSTTMRWSFASWGADLVINGHDHTYERLSSGGLTYVVNGLGGAGRYAFGTPLAESLVRYASNWGAMKLVSSPTALVATFTSIDGVERDAFTIGTPPPSVPGAFAKSSPAANAKNVSRAPTLSWGAASGATAYEYCYDSTVNGTCNGTWTDVGTATSVPLSGLLAKKNYEWQVRAVNAGGTTYANTTTWWKFTTVR